MNKICKHCKTQNREGASYCIGCRQPFSDVGAPGGTRRLTDFEGGGKRAGRGTVGESAVILESPPLAPGTEIGNWQVDRPLGNGGMGTVYLAHHRMLGHEVALKALSPALTDDPGFLSRFQREAETQAGVQHPNIARVLDYVEQDGDFYIVMEYLSGGALSNLIQRDGPLGLRDAIRIAQEALAGLEYAHRHNIIHRDVTSSNVMLDHLGCAKVTDFGIAVIAGARRETSPGVALGTPHYMSPEQISRPAKIDARTDIYSMGIVLYEMLTGRVPFDADADFEVQRAQVTDVPPPPRSINAGIPAWLDQVVLKALEKDPDRRYASCAEFAAALTHLEKPMAVAAPSPAAVEPRPEVPAPKVQKSAWMESFADAVGITGSLFLIPWPALWFGEFAAPLLESLLWIVGINFKLLSEIKKLHEAYSGTPWSTWLTVAGFACWGISGIAVLIHRKNQVTGNKVPA